MRRLDLALLALALPVFLAAGLPMLGYGVAAGAWLAQRGLQLLVEERAVESDRPGRVAGLLTGGMMVRCWMVAGAIFAVGAGDEDAGLAAAVLTIVLFTVYFTSSLALRPRRR
jgi:hypothetical protein